MYKHFKGVYRIGKKGCFFPKHSATPLHGLSLVLQFSSTGPHNLWTCVAPIFGRKQPFLQSMTTHLRLKSGTDLLPPLSPIHITILADPDGEALYKYQSFCDSLTAVHLQKLRPNGQLFLAASILLQRGCNGQFCCSVVLCLHLSLTSFLYRNSVA